MISNSNMPFMDHIIELRSRLFKSLLTIFIGAVVTHILSDELLLFLIEPSKSISQTFSLQVLDITSMFTVKLGLAIMGGIIISIPVIMFQVWSFVVPAFNGDYSISILLIVVLSTFFFLLGIAFGYIVLIPFSLEFFTNITSESINVNYNFTLIGYLTYVIWIIFACGLIYQLPILVLIGTKIGFITPPFLRHYRKFVVVFFLIISALLTPPDPLSQLFIFFPLVILYELSIFLSWIFNKND